MRFGVVSLFPEFVESVATYGVVGRAVRQEQIFVDYENPRDHALDAHRTVDDRPYGGGPGMVMKYEPVAAAIDALRERLPENSPVVYLSPQGALFGQDMARRFAELPGMLLLAGRYEGIDERLVETHVDEEVSIGDFVVSGGEIPTMTIIDAVSRLLPGVLGDVESAAQDSFMDGLLDCPHYTRPEVLGSRRVPDVLLSGDHRQIAEWREKQALGRSYDRRPELLEKMNLNDEQRRLLDDYLKEQRS